jgi:hypothetical protein
MEYKSQKINEANFLGNNAASSIEKQCCGTVTIFYGSGSDF